MEFSFNIQKLSNNVLCITLKGDILDRSQTEGLAMEVDNAFLDGFNRVMINLSEVNYMNSSGLSSLISLLTKARKADGEAVIFGLNERVERLIVLTKLNTIFSVYKTEKEALEAIKK